jgi:hypothetical protein
MQVSTAARRQQHPVPRWLSIALPLAFLAIAMLGNAHAATSSCVTMSGFGGSSPLNPGGAAFEPRECFQRSTSGASALAVAQSDGDRGIWRTNATASFGSAETASATARSIWNEQFVVINHPDLSQSGTSGIFFYEMYLEGFLDATGAGLANVQIRHFSTFVSEHTEFSISATADSGPKAIAQVIEGSLSFRFNEPFQFGIELRTSAQRRINRTGPGFADAVFGGTGYFGGITRVLDESGGEVQGFSFGGSNAGFTFTQSLVPTPVPLPPAAWLLACSLVTLACSTRRRI